MNSDNKVINKLFYKPCWGLAWRYSDCNHSDLTDASEFKFFSIIPPAKYYYADPFLVTDKNKVTWLFVELMDRDRGIGSIAVSKFDGKSFGKFTEIIKEPFHMSFPNVFQCNDDWFMIPETCAAKQLRLYKAEKFPYEWKLDTVLLDNVNLVDSCFFEYGKDMVLFDNDTKKSSLWTLNMSTRAIKQQEKYNLINERPAGNAFNIGNDKFRTLQDCSVEYGMKLILLKIDKDTEGNITEKKVRDITVENIKFEPYVERVRKIHTFNVSGNIECIDYNGPRFYLNKPLKKIIKKVNQHA